jgi:hypothetical protein
MGVLAALPFVIEMPLGEILAEIAHFACSESANVCETSSIIFNGFNDLQTP